MIEMANKELKEINNDSQNKEINIIKLQKEIAPSKKKKKKKKTLKIKRKKIKNNSSINLSNPKSKSKFRKKKQSLYNNNSSIEKFDHNLKASIKNSLDMKESVLSSVKNKRDLIHNTFNDKNKEIVKKYSDFELDDLEYSEAIIYDKRSFINFYIYIVKREHLIIFTFFYCTDFNLISIKLSLFVFSVCLDMTTNILFFDDESMHKIYLDYGKYNFVSQIPQIIYSTIISESMDIFLKYLSLSEKEIYEIKKYKNIKEVGDGIKQLIKCLKIKFFFFFLICFTFMIFFLVFYINFLCYL
jgi:hypothetical protein